MRGVLWAFVAAGLGLAVRGLLPPQPRDADVPTREFSAARAIPHVEFLAAAPRIAGGSHHAASRAYLAERLRALGLEPREQEATVAGHRVVNLLARRAGAGAVPGSVLLCAHYDSVPAGPGAGDDALGCAALLEIARALASEPPPERDLIFLFTDGEEVALLGARAFLLGGDGGIPPHPWAADVALALNFEGRGSGGPVWMFQTGPDNGALIGALTRAPAPAGSSLASAVYERMPNDSDLTPFLRAGLPGLNFACIDRFSSYHTARDVPERLDPGTVQHMGDQGLAVARWALAHSGGFAAPDAAYFNVLGRAFLRHPLAWTPALAVLAAVLSAIALRRLRTRLAAIALGALTTLAAVALPALAVLAATRLLPASFSYAASRSSDPYLRATGLATAGAAAAAAWAVLALAERRWRGLDTGAGALALTALGGIGASLALPEGAFLLLVPGLTIPLALLVRGAGPAALLSRGAAAATTVSLAGLWAYNLLLALALPGVLVPAAYAALTAAQLRPLWSFRPAAAPTG